MSPWAKFHLLHLFGISASTSIESLYSLTHSLYLALGHPLCQLFTAISIFLHNFYRVHTLNANFQSGRMRLAQRRLRFGLGHGTTIVCARPGSASSCQSSARHSNEDQRVL